MRIGIDIMGGDFAPKKTVHGAILALKELPSDTEIVLFGRRNEILSELKQQNTAILARHNLDDFDKSYLTQKTTFDISRR